MTRYEQDPGDTDMINVCQMIGRNSGWVNGPMVHSFRGENVPLKESLKTGTLFHRLFYSLSKTWLFYHLSSEIFSENI